MGTLIAYDNNAEYTSLVFFDEEGKEFQMLYSNTEGNNANYWVNDLFINSLNNMAGDI